MKNIKVIHMVTVSGSLGLMKGQIEYLLGRGYNIGVLSSPGNELDVLNLKNKISVPMERDINILKDIKSLLKLILIFYREKPDIVNTGTPKAGLLGILASFITRTPNRIYTLRGLKLETAHGIKKKILWFTEKIACVLATKVICISPSLKEEAIKLKLVKGEKIIILGEGSSNGIDLDNYPAPDTIQKEIQGLRNELKINTNNDFVIGFVGRIAKDKGINELIEAFKVIQQKHENVKLLMLGNFEDGDPVAPRNLSEIKNNKGIIYLGFIENPSLYYYLMDVFIFPTHREGFGNVSIQAQAAGTPVITSDATGAVDTVLDGETGYIVPVGDIKQIVKKLTYLKENNDIKMLLGIQARNSIIKNFDQKIIWREMDKFYKGLF